MQEAAGFNLNCTANDVSVAGVARDTQGDRIWITDPCQGPGDSVTFVAEFAVELNAQDRHDIGIYFNTDGDENGDGALTSDSSAQNGCSVTVLDYSGTKWVDLDGTNDPYPGQKKASGVQDTCGDIDAAHNPLYPAIEVTTKCVDSDGDGFLNLPNCVSWRQSGANELCTSPEDTFPGAPSKCKCDSGFNVPVPVPAEATFSKKVRKAGTTDQFSESVTFKESGGVAEYEVTYSFKTGDRTPDVTIQSLIDVPYGDITKTSSVISGTTCQVPVLLAGNGDDGRNGTYTCTFKTPVSGNPRTIVDTVTAYAVDGVGNDLSKFDTAQVVISNSTPSITVSKTATPDQVNEPGGLVTFSVLITNTSVPSDPVRIDTLLDDVHGDLNGKGDCAVPQTLAGAGGTYSCSFTVYVGGQAGYTETDKITASGQDDEGDDVTQEDSASVTVSDVAGAINVAKVASVSACNEPGCDVTFTVTIANQSTFDTVTIESLADDHFGSLSGQGNCKATPFDIAPSGSYSCRFTAHVGGEAYTSHTNTVTASGRDDDGQQVGDADDETVNFLNVPPAGMLTKSVSVMRVTYDVVVENDSPAEALKLTALADDKFCSITGPHLATDTCGEVASTTCSVPQTIPVGGDYRCSFDGIVTTSPHLNQVTGTLEDNDGSTPVMPSDTATVNFTN